MGDLNVKASASVTEIRLSSESITEFTGSSHPVKHSKSLPDLVTAETNCFNKILKDCASKNENFNFNLQNLIEGRKSPLFANNIVSDDIVETENSQHFENETNGSFLNSNVYEAPGYNYNKSDEKKKFYLTQPVYNSLYSSRTTAFDELDEMDDDEDTSSRKKRVKCLQVVILLISAIILSIVVIHFGTEPTICDSEYPRRL